MLYVRLDGSSFTYDLFHEHMEYAGVIDPSDGKLKIFKTYYDDKGSAIKRIELKEDEIK